MNALDIGCGRAKRPGSVGMDKMQLPGVDVVHDLNDLPWPFQDNQFDVVYASHILEHLPNLLGAMEEVHRILKPGGKFHVVVPYYRWEGAFQDPTHVRFFTERTFEYFTPDDYSDLSPMNYYSKARFTIENLDYGWRGLLSWHIENRIKHPRLRRILHRALRNIRSELVATLVAVK